MLPSLVVVLKGVADAVKDSNQLDSAERLYGAAVRDDLAKAVGAENNFEPTQATIIANVRDLPAIAEKIPVQFQSRFLELIQETHPIEARDITSRIILDACTPYEWENKPNEIFMDRDMLQQVSDRWNEYGFTGASPVAEMIGRLTRPQVKKK